MSRFRFGAALKRVNEMISKKNQSTVNGQQAATELKLLFKVRNIFVLHKFCDMKHCLDATRSVREA